MMSESASGSPQYPRRLIPRPRLTRLLRPGRRVGLFQPFPRRLAVRTGECLAEVGQRTPAPAHQAAQELEQGHGHTVAPRYHPIRRIDASSFVGREAARSSEWNARTDVA